MTAINFNWNVNDKLTNGKVYDFVFTDYASNAETPCTLRKDSNALFFNVGREELRVEIFRAGMIVRDAIAVALKRAGRVSSGEVYKANILLEVREDYEKEQIYSGIHYPSTEFITNFPHKDSAYFLGFELETAGRNALCETALHNIKSNIWRQVSDASIEGPRGARGIEFVSTLIHPSDAIKADFYADFCEMITGLALSSSLESTGLHCHISRTAFGEDEPTQNENIAKLIYLENFVLSSRALVKLYGRDGGRWARPNTSEVVEHVEALKAYCRDIVNQRGIHEALQTDLLRGNKTRCGHNYPEERYHRINITNQHTIEFRQGKGQIKSQSIANIAQHATTAAAYVCATKWANLSALGYYKSIPTSNKYGELKRIFAPDSQD